MDRKWTAENGPQKEWTAENSPQKNGPQRMDSGEWTAEEWIRKDWTAEARADAVHFFGAGPLRSIFRGTPCGPFFVEKCTAGGPPPKMDRKGPAPKKWTARRPAPKKCPFCVVHFSAVHFALSIFLRSILCGPFFCGPFFVVHFWDLAVHCHMLALIQN